MKQYHLYLLLKTTHEVNPADELLDAGLTPGQISKIVIEASRDGYLSRGQQSLTLTASGLEKLTELKSRKDLIIPDSSKWIKPQKSVRNKAKDNETVYIPKGLR